jgi:lipoprotein-anchoring transpeptidase ErfK/SrfK
VKNGEFGVCHLRFVILSSSPRSVALGVMPNIASRGDDGILPASFADNRLMPISRICLFAGLFAFAPAVFAQDASPSPSASTKPFVVDQTGAEKELKKEKGKNVAPTPTPDLRFPSNPIAPATPAPQESASNEPAVPRAEPVSAQEVLTRLQIFLDQRSFGPGKIDGRWGEFTAKALVRYQVANGQPPTGQIDTAMQQALSKIFPIYTDYTLTADDLQKVGDVPSKPSEQAKKKAMLYRSAGEFLGERFHADPDFIAKLNKDKKLDSLKVGDVVRVPNVPEFKIEDVKEVGHIPMRAEFSKRMIKIDTRYRMLDVYDGDKIVCSYPITPGSTRLPAPIGTWKIVGIATLPWFRWDEAMLEHGYRSDNYFNIPPGPRNPVGILWMGLNKRGIGIHGTNSPNTIGRAASHGCIRLANWDAARVVNQVTEGMIVQIY